MTETLPNPITPGIYRSRSGTAAYVLAVVAGKAIGYYEWRPYDIMVGYWNPHNGLWCDLPEPDGGTGLVCRVGDLPEGGAA